MNYRHSYHAGNFGDVLKHAVLALVIEYMKGKPAPFRFIDAHAGAGLYDLSLEAEKTGEWRDGVGRLMEADLPNDAAAALEPYLATVRDENPDDALRFYPGSPFLARRLMRPIDQLTLNELNLEECDRLRAHFAREPRAKVLNLDAWVAVKSLLPPKERRGLILIDPPFEVVDEVEHIVRGLRDATRRFATGTYVLWYPIKDRRAVAAFHGEVAALGLEKLLRVELAVGEPRPDQRLTAAGLLILNPPYTLPDALKTVLPVLSQVLAREHGAGHRLDWLARRSTERA